MQNEMKELINKLNNYTKAYDEGKPQVSDKEWDDLYFALEKMEKETGIIYPDSPTNSIQFDMVSSLEKVEHAYQPMLSLDKTKEISDLKNFVKGHEWLGMFKMDGLTVRLTYVNGNLVGAETRGDGEIGEWILHNAKVIPSIPNRIPTKDIGCHIYDIDKTVVIDGEVICTIPDFEKFKDEYKNPRNFAAGSIRLLNAEEAASRNLTFVAWDLVKGIDEDFFFYRLEKLDDWGFTTVPRVGDAETIEDAIEILNNKSEHELYPIDGYVFKFESVSYGKELGRTAHHWNSAMAYKFYNEEYETELVDIELSLGRTGQLTPVAIYNPITIDGAECTRASLHNISVMNEVLGIHPYVGQKIKIFKANEIIPQVSWANKDIDKVSDDNFIHITSCPICGGDIEIKDNDGVITAWCANPQCQGKLINRIDHYCGKRGLDVKGISKATLNKLIDWGFINELKDIYNLEKYRTEWESKSGFGKASVGKILNAIDAEGRHPKLEAFISAIGIPLVGRTVAKEIVKYYSTWEDFRNAVGGDWTEFEGFGPEMSKAINSFDYTEADEIVKFLTFQNNSSNNEINNKAKDLIFVITGRLSKKRDDIKKDIENSGGKVTNSVSSKTNYLVCNDKNSTTGKSADAKKLNIPIITEEELMKIIK